MNVSGNAMERVLVRVEPELKLSSDKTAAINPSIGQSIGQLEKIATVDVGISICQLYT